MTKQEMQTGHTASMEDYLEAVAMLQADSQNA